MSRLTPLLYLALGVAIACGVLAEGRLAAWVSVGSLLLGGMALWARGQQIERRSRTVAAEAAALAEEIEVRRGIEQALSAERNRAKDGALAKARFLANMSHEIRTPMNGVLGMTELALDTELPDESRQYLHVAKDSALALLALLDDILDHAKLESGHMELDPQPFRLREMLAACLKPLAVRAAQKGIELILDVDDDVPDAWVGDAVRLRQVVVNLVGNAIKFTAAGEVSVHAAWGDDADADDAARLHLSVCDTGIGIPHERQAAIFQAFQQATTSTTREFGGTGLGLSISHWIARAMDGDIRVESTPGVGSTFHVDLRLVQDRDAQDLPDPAQAGLAGRHLVLLAEHPGTRRVLRRQLEALGMEVTWFPDGATAQRALLADPLAVQEVDAVVVDGPLPDMDAAEVARRLRRLAGMHACPFVLLLDGHGGTEEREALARLYRALLLKPVGRDELTATLLLLWSSLAAPLPVELQAPRRIAPLRILLAEDNPVNQRVATLLLTKRGHDVVLAANGEEAITLWEAGTFDVILMDAQMPVLGGLEATQRIRDLECSREMPRIPILAMTALAMPGDKARCLRAGMDAHLAKPIRPAEVFDALARHVPAATRDIRDVA